MRVFRSLPHAESSAPCALTIGNFDGVHRGHQALLARMRAVADARGLPVCVLTFEPHPREFFDLASAPPRISLLRDKLEALRANGVDRVVVVHFNRTFASQSPQAFVEKVIVGGLHARWLLIGDDFRYGARRAGDFASLQQAGLRSLQGLHDLRDLRSGGGAGSASGFEVERMGTVADAAGVRISSSGVRAALQAGDFDAAHAALGRGYAISGHVVHGMKLGRSLGFPTLNLPVSHRAHKASLRPAVAGIFVVRVHGLAAAPLPGVASIGLRPTVDDSGRVLLEVHLLDWRGDAYGRLVRVEFLNKLRDEEKFIDLDTLTAAIARDVEHARAWFTANETGGMPGNAGGSGGGMPGNVSGSGSSMPGNADGSGMSGAPDGPDVPDASGVTASGVSGAMVSSACQTARQPAVHQPTAHQPAACQTATQPASTGNRATGFATSATDRIR